MFLSLQHARGIERNGWGCMATLVQSSSLFVWQAALVPRRAEGVSQAADTTPRLLPILPPSPSVNPNSHHVSADLLIM